MQFLKLCFVFLFLAASSVGQSAENPYLNCESSDAGNTYLFEVAVESSSRSVENGGLLRDTKTVAYAKGQAKLTIQSKFSKGHVYEHLYLGEIQVTEKERLIRRNKKPTYHFKASAIPFSYDLLQGVLVDNHPTRSGALSLSMFETVDSKAEALQLMNGEKSFRQYFAHRIVEDRHNYPVRLQWDCRLINFKWD